MTVLSGPAKGVRLVIDTHYEKSFWTGAHEPEVLGVLASLLRPGSVYWDVGAHIGLHALFASRCVGPAGHVHAFEPSPSTAIRLRHGVALNHANNVTVHELALSDQAGDAVLYDADASAMRTLVPAVSHTTGQPVQCETADRMAETLGCPDVIKIDAEGAEQMVLDGARQLLRRSATILIVEYWTPEAVAQAQSAFPRYHFAQLDHLNWLMTPPAESKIS